MRIAAGERECDEGDAQDKPEDQSIAVAMGVPLGQRCRKTTRQMM